jgi:dynein heavy chain
MGFFDETSREWTDGVLSHGIRNASSDLSGKRQIITCDGPIEPDWVENMNSVLDDNKRLSLITGETLYLTN